MNVSIIKKDIIEKIDNIFNEYKYDDYCNLVNALNNSNFNKEDKESICEYMEDAYNIELKICSECDNFMWQGYCIENGFEYYCSDECLHKNMTQEEFDNLYDNGQGDTYWTDWD